MDGSDAHSFVHRSTIIWILYTIADNA